MAGTNTPTEQEFADELLDSIYLNGAKEDGKYTLTLPQAEQVAREMYRRYFAQQKPQE